MDVFTQLVPTSSGELGRKQGFSMSSNFLMPSITLSLRVCLNSFSLSQRARLNRKSSLVLVLTQEENNKWSIQFDKKRESNNTLCVCRCCVCWCDTMPLRQVWRLGCLTYATVADKEPDCVLSYSFHKHPLTYPGHSDTRQNLELVFSGIAIHERQGASTVRICIYF